jgi:Protein of unknown function (DUF1570)
MHRPRLRHLRFFVLPILAVLSAADRPNPGKLDDASLRELDTHHYQIHTDLEPLLVTDLGVRMDAMYEQYGNAFKQFLLPANAPALPVYLFDKKDKYMAFTDYAGTNTGGLFVSGRHPYLTAFLQGQGRDALKRTLQHEAFHQFAHAAIARQLPPWLNEGLAQYFEESIWTGKDFLSAQIPPRRLRQLKLDIDQKRIIDFDQFMNQSGREWSDTLHTNVVKAGTAYNQAWAMVCFCLAGDDDHYRADLMALLDKLHRADSSPEDAIRQCFPDKKEFHQKFSVWAAKAKATPEATMMERQETLGDFLLALQKNKIHIPADMAGVRDLAIRYNLKIQYTRGSVTYSSSDRPASYFEDEDGQPFKAADLYLEKSEETPFPDIICKTKAIVWRTHFYISGGETEHETGVE